MNAYIMPGLDKSPYKLIEQVVCSAMGVEDISTPGRAQTSVKPRQIAMYLARKHYKLKYTEIGKRYERDHATAIHAFVTVRNLIECRDPDYYQLIRHIEKMLDLQKFKLHMYLNTMNT